MGRNQPGGELLQSTAKVATNAGVRGAGLCVAGAAHAEGDLCIRVA